MKRRSSICFSSLNVKCKRKVKTVIMLKVNSSIALCVLPRDLAITYMQYAKKLTLLANIDMYKKTKHFKRINHKNLKKAKKQNSF